MEFYFSESNLPRDRFLRAEVAKTPNGAVGLALVCSFSRMRALLDIASATSDVPDATVAAVAACLQAGAPSLMLEQPGGACHERCLPRRRECVLRVCLMTSYVAIRVSSVLLRTASPSEHERN